MINPEILDALCADLGAGIRWEILNNSTPYPFALRSLAQGQFKSTYCFVRFTASSFELYGQTQFTVDLANPRMFDILGEKLRDSDFMFGTHRYLDEPLMGSEIR